MTLIIIQIWTLVMQVFILISIIQMTAGNFKEDRARKKKVQDSQISKGGLP